MPATSQEVAQDAILRGYFTFPATIDAAVEVRVQSECLLARRRFYHEEHFRHLVFDAHGEEGRAGAIETILVVEAGKEFIQYLIVMRRILRGASYGGSDSPATTRVRRGDGGGRPARPSAAATMVRRWGIGLRLPDFWDMSRFPRRCIALEVDRLPQRSIGHQMLPAQSVPRYRTGRTFCEPFQDGLPLVRVSCD